MELRNIPVGAIAASGFGIPCNGPRPINSVIDESKWRALPQTFTGMLPDQRVLATRWRAAAQGTQEASAETADNCHIVKIVLRNMNIQLSVAGRTVQDGVATPGTFHVTEPSTSVRCVFRGPYDVLHLHVPTDLVAECGQDMPGDQTPKLCSTLAPTKDPTVERLGRALVESDQIDETFRQLYSDCISVAIVARLIAWGRASASTEHRKTSELPRWRLKRALDYVESHLAEPVRLADVASATGLTRMHFAAQFRASTGLSPHEYLLRRRVERAQEMLMRSGMSVVDVALSVGFQTQSHFTTVFRRFAGQPPQTWRRVSRDQMAAFPMAS